MNCPYCTERVSDAAIVCMHCHRDLFLIRPLMDKLAEATKRLEAIETAGPAGQPAVASAPRRRRASPLPALTALSAMSLMFILLVAAHFIIIVEYSLPLVLLRTVSILLPLAFGFLCEETANRTLLVEFVYGLAVAVAAILSMSVIVGKLDHVPVLPRGAYEWREFAEYGASITFGFFTGVIIRHSVIAMRSPETVKHWLIESATRAVAKRAGGKVAGVGLNIVGPIIRTAAAIASGTVAISTGFKQFF